jgi:serine/threonine protein kinase
VRVGSFELEEQLRGSLPGIARFIARAADGERVTVTVIDLMPSDHSFVTMAIDDAGLLRELVHPNITRLFATGIDDGRAFVASELIIGAMLEQLAPIPLAIAARVVRDACIGLHHAHDYRELGIVHRMLSTDTIGVTSDGCVKIFDFGMSRSFSRIVTEERHKLSPYLSPEQCLARAIDRRSDVYALGAVLWELTVGEPRFPSASDFDMLVAIAKSDPEPPSARRPDYPRELERVVMRALARDRDARYRTAAELGAALDATGLCAEPARLAELVRPRAAVTTSVGII